MHKFFFQNEMQFCVLISLMFLVGCIEPDFTSSKIYKETLSGMDQINCPELKIIKNLDQFSKRDENLALYYIVKFNKVSWECYKEYEKSVDAESSLMDQIIGTESNISSTINSRIDVDISFLISTGDYQDKKKYESFNYLIAVIDEKNNIIVRNIFEYNFTLDVSDEQFVLNEKKINVVLPNVDIATGKFRILLGFINYEE